MDLSNIIKAIMAPLDGSRSNTGMPELQPGDRLVGRVLRLESDGRLLIDLAGRRALAQTNLDARPGQALQLQVVSLGPPLHLRLETSAESIARPTAQAVPAPGGLIPSENREFIALIDRLIQVDRSPQVNRSLSHAGSTADKPEYPQGSQASFPPVIRHALTVVREALMPLLLSQPAEQISAALQQRLEESGLLYERRLADIVISLKSEPPGQPAASDPLPGPQAVERMPLHTIDALIQRDLKPSLLMLKTFFGPPSELPQPTTAALDPQDLAGVRQGIERMLSHLVEQQDRIVQRTAENDYSQAVLHWLPVEEQARPVGLRIHYPRAGRDRGTDGQIFRVALLLQLDRLGPLQVELALLGKGLRVDFHLRDVQVKDLVEAHKTEIRDALGPHFEAVSVAVHVAEEKIAEFMQDQGEWRGPDGRRIDLKV